MGILKKLFGSKRSSSSSKPKPWTGFATIHDRFECISQVQQALVMGGLESSNLIVAVDFTQSNQWTGKQSFGGACLHTTSADRMNPYELAISIIGNTLLPFDEDKMIPCYGFGDARTKDKHVFSFLPHNAPCHGFQHALQCYRELLASKALLLSGPTSFAPAIYQATRVVAESGGQYHILLLIADGQVTMNEDGSLSAQEQETIHAIVQASKYPLSIIMVGVGDGPWEQMKRFDDKLPMRAFDNFQFVNLTEVYARGAGQSREQLEADFALQALMEVPEQYRAIKALKLLGKSAPFQCNTQVMQPPALVGNTVHAAPGSPGSGYGQPASPWGSHHMSHPPAGYPAVR